VIQPVTAEELIDEIRDADADLVVVNFWASWCLPCREEFPEFVRYSREMDPGEVQVQFVTVDFEEDLPHAAQFLREHGIGGMTFVKDGKEGRFIDEINPSWTGAIPATAVFDGDGNRLAFWEGKVTYDQLVRRVNDARASS
jgi:thiol-disulfide isomerase/thioredoxin